MTLRVRLRAIWCCLKYGLLPSRWYELEPHHDLTYLAHLWLNLRYAAVLATGRETEADRAFERETNP